MEKMVLPPQKPLIGVCVDLGQDGLVKVRNHYLQSITRAGGLPIVLPVSAPKEDLFALFDCLDGLLLTGGADIDPVHYGEAATPELGDLNPARDAAEIPLAQRARERNLPTLGICRGAQVMNVAGGGTLIQDIEHALHVPKDVHSQPEDYEVTTHNVTIEPETLLARVVGKSEIAVNSRHHQAVKVLGDGLQLCARSSADGIVESFCDPTKSFYLAVQWHPEMLSHAHAEAHALFVGLVDAACKKSEIAKRNP